MAKRGTATPAKVQAQKDALAKKEASVELPPDVLEAIEAEEGKRREAFEKELTAKRESLVRIATLQVQRKAAQVAWNEAEANLRQIDKELSRLTGKATTGNAAGSGAAPGTRMKAEEKAALGEKALAFIEAAKGGVSRGEIVEHLNIQKTQSGTILNPLKKAKKIRTEGKKAATKYFAA